MQSPIMPETDTARKADYVARQALTGTVSSAMSLAGPPLRTAAAGLLNKELYLDRNGEFGEFTKDGTPLLVRAGKLLINASPAMETALEMLEEGTRVGVQTNPKKSAEEWRNMLSAALSVYSPVKFEFREPSEKARARARKTGLSVSRQMKKRAIELNKSISESAEPFESMVNDILLEESVRD
jgi:hypothetical protein